MINNPEKIAAKWPSSIVARREVSKFTGGCLSGKTLANLASRGETVPTSIKIGGKVAYDALDLASWLCDRAR